MLNGELKLNNSVIAWSEIGEGSGSLFCLTDNMNCCEATLDSESQWVNPENDTIANNLLPSLSSDGIYQEHRKSSILLQRQDIIPSLKGIFRCDVVDANNQMQQLYVGIYPQSGNSEG